YITRTTPHDLRTPSLHDALPISARSVTVTFTPLPVDTTPPARAGGRPTGTLAAGTTQTTLSLVTGEAATCRFATSTGVPYGAMRSEEHTSELQSLRHLVCRLLLE